MFSSLFDSSKASSDPNVPAKEKATGTEAPSKKRRRRRKGKHHDKQIDGPNSSSDTDINNVAAKRASSSDLAVHRRPSKRTKRQPSEAALALSAKLKEYSTQKRLDDALNLYWDKSNDSIRDEHHACIVIDCSARCGAIAEGEKVVDDMKKSGMKVNVQAKTALLKGYAHSGMIRRGAYLFREMCRSKDKRSRPNVRTLNTLLRGCLWTATTSDGSGELSGGIAAAEESWNLFRSCVSVEDLNSSSYEYYIAQLCYALRVEEAKRVIDEMKRKYDVTTDEALNEADASIVESLAVSLVALARTMALLKLYDEGAAVAKNALHVSSMAKRLMKASENESVSGASGTSGGKRGWKKQDSRSLAPRRAVSNSLFRSHRLSEVEAEAANLLSICSLRPEEVNLAFYLVTRLLYFSGGGTTDQSACQDESAAGDSDDTSLVKSELMNSLWHSFGLRTALGNTVSGLTSESVVGEQERLRIQSAVRLPETSVISNDGFIDFREVFRIPSERSNTEMMGSRPLDVELGSGFGDWIVHQAMSNPMRAYVAVELRADRVAQAFSKALLNGSSSPLNNLCCVGSECGSFLRRRVRQGSVATVFVNHPEPPTQTFGCNSQILANIAGGDEEPAHMLSSDTLVAAAKCLQSTGRLIIVTDNRWYGRLICVTLVKAMKTCAGLIRSSDLSGCKGIRQVETFGTGRERVVLYEGQPSEAIGHSGRGNGTTGGASYFDRLWRSGAGTHAERRNRFIIVMDREQSGGIAPRSGNARDESQMSGRKKSGKSGKKNRKKSEAKQRRRNERRLAKRGASKET